MADAETARRDAIVLVHSITPDACFLPPGSVAPFQIVANGVDAENTCSTVHATGQPVMNMVSIFSVCYNDEGGVAGVKSGTVKGVVTPIENACKVKALGQHILRDGDLVWMNNGNCLGIVKIVVKKMVIIAHPVGPSSDNAVSYLRDKYPDADYLDPGRLATQPDLSGYDKVLFHGHGGPIQSTGKPAIWPIMNDKSAMSPDQVSDFLNAGGFKGSSVEFANCNTATSLNGNKPFADQVAKKLGIPVTGYPHGIAVKPGGHIIRRIEATGWNIPDKIVTQFDYMIGGSSTEATPVTFPGK